MRVPKYIQDLMNRAKYDYTTTGNNYAVGYTIRISKRTEYQTVETFRDEIARLVAWVRKNSAECIIIAIPYISHYYTQQAIVTIYDPVMKYLQPFIKE